MDASVPRATSTDTTDSLPILLRPYFVATFIATAPASPPRDVIGCDADTASAARHLPHWPPALPAAHRQGPTFIVSLHDVEYIH